MISKNVFTQLYGVVLFAYFEKSVLYCFIEKRSITFVLNNNGLNIETWGTPNIMPRMPLQKELIFVT